MGERLVCVRYKYDITGKEKLKTIELIVEREPWDAGNKVWKLACSKIKVLNLQDRIVGEENGL